MDWANAVQTLLQTIITAFSGWLASAGWITSDMTEEVIGALLFLLMLVLNIWLANRSKKDPQR